MEVEKEVLKGQVKFMAMVIGNNMGISNAYQNSASKTGGYKNVREYSNYLMGKYSCLKPGNNVVRMGSPYCWAPDIDCFTLKKIE